MSRVALAWVSVIVGASIGCGATRANVPTVYSTGVQVASDPSASRAADVLAQPGRSASDRALDVPRQAAEVLAYLDIKPGMNVAVFAPGRGYFMELVARSVGLDGSLFARNPPSLLAASKLGPAWDQRLAQPAGARVIQIDDELSKPLTVHWLDLVFLDHDYAALGARGVDTSSVDGVVWNALRDGGRFVVVEREADSAKTRARVEAEGFRLASSGDFLRPDADPTDWGYGREPSSVKRVLLTFVKPAPGAEISPTRIPGPH